MSSDLEILKGFNFISSESVQAYLTLFNKYGLDVSKMKDHLDSFLLSNNIEILNISHLSKFERHLQLNNTHIAKKAPTPIKRSDPSNFASPIKLNKFSSAGSPQPTTATTTPSKFNSPPPSSFASPSSTLTSPLNPFSSPSLNNNNESNIVFKSREELDEEIKNRFSSEVIYFFDDKLNHLCYNKDLILDNDVIKNEINIDTKINIKLLSSNYEKKNKDNNNINDFRYMNSSINYRNFFLGKQYKSMKEKFLSKYSNLINQDDIYVSENQYEIDSKWFFGRIIMDPIDYIANIDNNKSIKPNKFILKLECIGQSETVEFNLDLTKKDLKVSLFTGQYVFIYGNVVNGMLYADNILTDIREDQMNNDNKDIDQSFSCYIFKGPYFVNDKIKKEKGKEKPDIYAIKKEKNEIQDNDRKGEYQPIDHIIRFIKDNNVNVAIFLGPIIEDDHKYIIEGQVNPSIYYERFENRIENSIKKNPNLQILIVPSIKDFEHTLAFPQPPYNNNINSKEKQKNSDSNVFMPFSFKKNDRVSFLTNPSIISINNVTFAISSDYLLSHFPSREVNIDGEKMHYKRHINYLLSQQSFYPSTFSIPKDMNFDFKIAKETNLLSLKEEPNVIIIPSGTIIADPKVSDNTVYVNPGNVINPRNNQDILGSFCGLNIYSKSFLIKEKNLNENDIKFKDQISIKLHTFNEIK